MSSDILRMHERTIKKNLDIIENQLNKGEIGDYNRLKDVIDLVNHKIAETEKEIKLINIEITMNAIKNNSFNLKEISQKTHLGCFTSQTGEWIYYAKNP